MESNKENTEMKKEITVGQLISIMIPIIIMILIWGISVETRFTEFAQRIQLNERSHIKVEKKLEQIDDKLLKILLELQVKKDK
jgi:hypothetical protein